MGEDSKLQKVDSEAKDTGINTEEAICSRISVPITSVSRMDEYVHRKSHSGPVSQERNCPKESNDVLLNKSCCSPIRMRKKSKESSNGDHIDHRLKQIEDDNISSELSQIASGTSGIGGMTIANKRMFRQKSWGENLSSGYHSSSPIIKHGNTVISSSNRSCITASHNTINTLCVVYPDPASVSGSTDNSNCDRNTSLANTKRAKSLGNIANDFGLYVPWEIYCRLLPKAKKSMETKLSEFLEKYTSSRFDQLKLDPCEKFASQQIVKIVRTLYIKSLSLSHNLTSEHFSEIMSKLDDLLAETAQKCAQPMVCIHELAQKVTLIISRTARLLKCIEEIEPNKLNHIIRQEENEVMMRNKRFDLASYIKNKLGNNLVDEDQVSEVSEQTSPKVRVSHSRYLPSIALKRFKVKPSSSRNVFPPETSDSSFNSKTSQDTSIQYWSPKEKDFPIIKLISQGAFGAVYLVRHVSNNKKYALKKISKQHALLKNQVRQVFAERDILSFTENPFVVSMICSFETRYHFCMVMEYVEGGDCASLLKALGVFPIEMARTYFAETLLAVEYIHNYGIIHRDIKPDNLLITALGHIKLTDFGLSKIGLMNMTTQISEYYNAEFHDRQIQGTPDYVAPEVILNKPYGRAVDYWSLGIVLYEFLIGCTPFYGETPDEVFESIIRGEIEWPEGEEAISEDAQHLICRLLDRNPSLRFGSQCSQEVKAHQFFLNIEWTSLIRRKAEFIPNIMNDEDTSYFDTRSSRYHHHQQQYECDSNAPSDCDDTASTDDQFTFCTKRFKDEIFTAKLQNERQTSSPQVASTNSSPSMASISSLGVKQKQQQQQQQPGGIPATQNMFESTTTNNTKLVRHGPAVRKALSKSWMAYVGSGSFNNETRNPKINLGNNNVMTSLPLSSTSARVSKEETNKKLQTSPSTPVTMRSTDVPRKSSPSSSCHEQVQEGSLTQKNKEQQPTLSSSSSSIISNSNHHQVVNLVRATESKTFGFNIKTIRVFLTKLKSYVLYHMVEHVDKGTVADKAGLKPGWIITHMNGQLIDGFNNVEVMSILCSSGDALTLTISLPENIGIYPVANTFNRFVKGTHVGYKELHRKKAHDNQVQGALMGRRDDSFTLLYHDDNAMVSSSSNSSESPARGGEASRDNISASSARGSDSSENFLLGGEAATFGRKTFRNLFSRGGAKQKTAEEEAQIRSVDIPASCYFDDDSPSASYFTTSYSYEQISALPQYWTINRGSHLASSGRRNNHEVKLSPLVLQESASIGFDHKASSYGKKSIQHYPSDPIGSQKGRGKSAKAVVTGQSNIKRNIVSNPIKSFMSSRSTIKLKNFFNRRRNKTSSVLGPTPPITASVDPSIKLSPNLDRIIKDLENSVNKRYEPQSRK